MCGDWAEMMGGGDDDYYARLNIKSNKCVRYHMPLCWYASSLALASASIDTEPHTGPWVWAIKSFERKIYIL